MCWGNFVEHGAKVFDESIAFGHRFVHLLIAFAEFFPGVSQIVSLAEMIFSECCSYSNDQSYSLFLTKSRPMPAIDLELKASKLKEFKTLHHELCEITSKGDEKPCTFNRLQEIVAELKANNVLFILNEVPKYFIIASGGIFPSQHRYTPLQYWASKGDLEAVQFLLEQGAVDCPAERKQTFHRSITVYSDEVHLPKSALFVAALNGHVEVVKYLLSQGASPNIAFFSILFAFMPKLIFEMIKKYIDTRKNPSYLECLTLLFESMSKGAIKFQLLEIPVAYYDRSQQRRSIVDYLSDCVNRDPASYQSELSSPIYDFIIEKLNELGIDPKETAVKSNEELKQAGYPIGTGNNLYDIARLK